MRYEKFHGCVFQVTDGTPVLIERYVEVPDARRVLSAEVDQENIWGDAPEVLDIYVSKDGLGFVHEIPNGYSSYTYDPEWEERFYKGASFEWFMNQALDGHQREMLDDSDKEIIKQAFDDARKENNESQE